jgi:hypothetical protein
MCEDGRIVARTSLKDGTKLLEIRGFFGIDGCASLSPSTTPADANDRGARQAKGRTR